MTLSREEPMQGGVYMYTFVHPNREEKEKMNKADQKARMARAQASARGQTPMLINDPTGIPGFDAWMVGEVLVMMPKLLPGAPASIRRRYRDRIIANATGRCPRCHNIPGGTTPGKQIDHADLTHESDCPVSLFEEEAERWLDPAARPARQALQWNREGKPHD